MSFERPLRLLASFTSAGLEINVKTFDSRFFVQKNGYFLQEFGADLGYTFGLYVHGPYSPMLAKDAYILQDLEYEREEVEAVSVNPEVNAHMTAFMEDVSQLISDSKDRKYWFELLASLHFLFKYKYPKIRNLGDAKSQSKLVRFGDDIETAFGVLRRHNLL